MNRLQYKKGLLYVAIELKHNGKSITIEDVIIDTGASHTIITTEYLEKMDRMKIVLTKANIPVLLVKELEQQIERLKQVRINYNQTSISPFTFYPR